MDDLISRKALLEEFRKRSDEPFELWDSYDIFKIIHNAPTVDAVEVVRCKYCKYWDGWCIGIPINGDDATYIETQENDYCSYGKRKENT